LGGGVETRAAALVAIRVKAGSGEWLDAGQWVVIEVRVAEGDAVLYIRLLHPFARTHPFASRPFETPPQVGAVNCCHPQNKIVGSNIQWQHQLFFDIRF